MLIIPEEYIVTKFFQYCGNAKYNKHNKTYQGSCSVCREGNSWLSKRRCYFIPDKNNIFCHNCGWSSGPYKWLQQVTGFTFKDLTKDIESSGINIEITTNENTLVEKITVDALPKDCINLSDEIQVNFYRDNIFVKRALDFLNKRNLINAVNRPKSFYISLSDFVHKNRLIIPFYSSNNKILHYQSRDILNTNSNKPRYLSKVNSEKTIFNLNNIDNKNENIFIFEGPLNACFCKNGVAVAGIQEKSIGSFSVKQLEQIKEFSSYKKIWVLDSQWLDKTAYHKSKVLLSQDECVFIWPENIGKKCKDFNDIAIAIKSVGISTEYILKHTYCGIKGDFLLGVIGNNNLHKN